MWKSLIVFVFLSLILTISGSVFAVDDSKQWNKTRAIKELPFCAFILRDFLGEFDRGREIYILMEPDQVTESNLSVLFKLVSEKYPKPFLLKVWVTTDVEQLADIATGQMMDVASAKKSEDGELPPQVAHNKKNTKAPQLAFYKRTEEVELFRYNHNYPEPGEKTVILKGKE